MENGMHMILWVISFQFISYVATLNWGSKANIAGLEWTMGSSAVRHPRPWAADTSACRYDSHKDAVEKIKLTGSTADLLLCISSQAIMRPEAFVGGIETHRT